MIQYRRNIKLEGIALKKILMLIALILAFSLIFTSCGDDDDNNSSTDVTPNGSGNSSGNSSGGDEEHTLKWNDPGFVFIGDYLTWSSDKEADAYHVYLDGKECRVVGNEYIELNVSTQKEYKVQIAKEIDGAYYYSEEFSFTPAAYTETVITSLDDLKSTYYQNNSYQLGSIKYNSIVINLAGTAESSLSFASTIKVGTMLDSLTIKCNGSTSLKDFGIEIEERTKPLTIIFDNVTLSTTSRKNMILYTGTTEFETNIIMKGKCTVANSTAGENGTNGAGGSGISSAANGTPGGNGGNIFSIPKAKLFTENQPDFVTGDGGRGGNGGTGSYGAHGGYGGAGGNGGYVFANGTVRAFNAKFRDYSGSFGNGGRGGAGGSGISGTRKSGATGAQGAFASGSVNLTYLSRRDGIIHTAGGEGQNEVGFELSFVNDYIVWAEQPNAIKYELFKDGEKFAETTANTYYLSYTEAASVTSAKVTVRPVYESGKTGTFETSSPLKIYDETNAVLTTSVSKTLEGAEYFMIAASQLSSVGELSVGSDVRRISIFNDSNTDRALLHLSIVANARGANLIIDLNNIRLISSATSKYGAITFNDGNGATDGSAPLLIINSTNSQIFGKDGSTGSTGSYGSNGAEGGNGGNGENGKGAILAAYVAAMGTSLSIGGGKGGDGGAGGGASINNGGDGGNGGNGGTALKCNMLYVIMNEENSPVTIYTSSGGAGGARGDGFGNYMDSSRPGSSGSNGASLVGNYRKLIGAFSS